MELLIDTNVLYYLSGISVNNKINIINLEDELSNYELSISKWSLVEIIANNEMSILQKETILKYIADKKIKVIPIIGITLFDIMPLNLADIINSPHKFKIINSIIEGKKKCEIEFMACYIKSFICIFSMALFYQMEAKGEKDKNIFMFLTQSFIMSNNDFIISKTKEIINNFYLNNEESIFKSEIDGFIFTLLYANIVIFIGVKHGYLHEVFPDVEIVTLESGESELSDNILSSKIAKELLQKLGGEDIKNIVNKLGATNIRKSMSDYITVIGSQMPKGVCKFILAVVEKMLSEKMKITKNDIIDAFLLDNYPQIQLFTFDSRFQKIIKIFDEQYFNFIVTLQNKCK